MQLHLAPEAPHYRSGASLIPDNGEPDGHTKAGFLPANQRRGSGWNTWLDSAEVPMTTFACSTFQKVPFGAFFGKLSL